MPYQDINPVDGALVPTVEILGSATSRSCTQTCRRGGPLPGQGGRTRLRRAQCPGSLDLLDPVDRLGGDLLSIAVQHAHVLTIEQDIFDATSAAPMAFIVPVAVPPAASWTPKRLNGTLAMDRFIAFAMS